MTGSSALHVPGEQEGAGAEEEEGEGPHVFAAAKEMRAGAEGCAAVRKAGGAGTQAGALRLCAGSAKGGVKPEHDYCRDLLLALSHCPLAVWLPLLCADAVAPPHGN